MTPRRRLHCALTVVGSGIVAAALAGCSNGVHVAGPTEPHESVISGAATPSAAASSAKAKDGPKSTASPSAEGTGSRTDGNQDKGGNDSGSGTDSGGNSNSGTRHDGQGKKNGKHRKGGSKDGQHSGDEGIGSPSSTSTPKSKDSDSPETDDGGTGTDGTSQQDDSKRRGGSNKGRTCELGDLTVGARVPAGSGAAGSQYVLITFTNKSGAPCWMYGYAGVSFVGNQDGTQLGKPARRAKSVSASPVKLADGDTETELLKIADAGVWDAKECVPTTADGFRIYPPSSYTAAYVKFSTTACQSKSVRQLTVFPIGTKS